MKHRLIIAAAAFACATGALLSSAVLSPLAAQSAAAQVAALETQTLTVENMTCALCPVTVKKAMEGIDGVRDVEIDFDAKTATVTFDPSTASPDAIAAASANAGYPAHPAHPER